MQLWESKKYTTAAKHLGFIFTAALLALQSLVAYFATDCFSSGGRVF